MVAKVNAENAFDQRLGNLLEVPIDRDGFDDRATAAQAIERMMQIFFDIGADGTLSGRRTWADLGDGVPDGICADEHDAVWYADVPGQRCVRVAAGGDVLQTVELDRGAFACMLGRTDRRTLFITAAQWRGMTGGQMVEPGSGQLLATEVEVPGAGWP